VAASSLFEHKSAGLSEVFRALRVAELELSQSYDPEVHDPWFASFNWEAFSRDEFQLLPVVVALDHADHIASKGLYAFSRLLRSGRPAQLLVLVTPGQNPGTEPGEDPLASYRFELGYAGISHREAMVAQSSLAQPQHLIEGFLRALDTTRTGVHLLSTGTGTSSRINPWLSAGAALESRAHPFFRYNPEAGLSWAQSMDFAGNPEPESDWPSHPLEYRESDSEGSQSTFVAFTFADFALLDPTLRQHFRLVPEGYTRDELTPVDAYLTLEPGQAIKHVPFVWGIDGESRLRRLVLSRELILACQDRQGYWRTLQSLAGVKNEYADTAAKQARAKAIAEAAEERKNLEAAHEERLSRVREETAGEVMGRLADALMGLDLTQAQAAAPQPAAAPAESSAETAAPAEAPEPVAEPTPAEEDEDEVSFDEPWIDTVLCTSCNDCMKFNPLVFVYNENKQALIGDAKAGTYEQIVMAAEKCPARCIHPGKPLNPDEPNLEELIERAKPFN
jgi:ferredoxin